MEEQRSSEGKAPYLISNWSDRRCLLVLLVLALALRVWHLVTTEVTSRDSIAYIRYAWRLGHEPWHQVITSETQHPGYGFLIYALAGPVRAILSDLPYAMQLSAQLAASLASLLLVIPMYYLGKALFGNRVGFWTALLFQVLPSSGRLMADGLSEPLFLLLVTTSLYLVHRAIENGSYRQFLLAGFTTGLAYLTRTEGLLVVPVATLILLLRRRRNWLGQSLSLCGACSCVVVPFMLLIGGISLKASLKNITDPKGWQQPARPAAVVRSPLPLALWWIDPGVTPADRVGWATRALVITLDKSLFHVFDPLTLLGMWVFRRRLFEVPIASIMMLSGLILLALLWRLAQAAGYIGERHVLLIVLGSMYFATAAVCWLGRSQPRWFTLVGLLVLTGICLPKLLTPLHANRAGFRQAGQWLAQNSLPGDEVFDPLAWTSYHSGKLFVPSDAPRSIPEVCYVVMEESSNKHPHLWYLLDLAKELIQHGKEVYRQPLDRKSEIVIYRVCRPPIHSPAGQQLRAWLNVNMGRRVQE